MTEELLKSIFTKLSEVKKKLSAKDVNTENIYKGKSFNII